MRDPRARSWLRQFGRPLTGHTDNVSIIAVSKPVAMVSKLADTGPFAGHSFEERYVSFDGCETGDRSPAMRRADASSPLAPVLILFLTLHAFMTPSSAALAAHSSPQSRVAAEVLRADASHVPAHAIVETIRRMQAPLLRNTDTSSALAETGGTAAKMGMSTGRSARREDLFEKWGVAAPARAPPPIADISV